MFEQDLNYCPQCQDEYRADIEKCPVCACDLLPGSEMIARKEKQQQKMADRSGELSPDDDLVAVKRGPLAEMRAYEELLSGERICTVLAGDESSCGKGCCGGGTFDLLVRREEAHDAVLIIEAEIRRTAVIDSVAHDGAAAGDSVFDPLAPGNTCPACGHQFSGGMECPDCGLCF
ncbi:MAG: hypothetical protein ABFS18_01575 [Thermodesulfobacteriota bacterium]